MAQSKVRTVRTVVNSLGVVILATGLAGTAAAQTPYTPPSPTINVTMEISAEGGGKPVIIGKTNLPDGFGAIVSLKELPTPSSPGGLMLGQDKVEVHSGKFSAGPFSIDGAAYPSGTYVVSFDAPDASLQPPAVRAAIGPHGAFLRGEWVKEDLQLSEPERLVAYRTTIEIR